MSSMHVSRETCTWGVPNNGIKCRGARDKGRGARDKGRGTRAERPVASAERPVASAERPVQRGLWRVTLGKGHISCNRT